MDWKDHGRHLVKYGAERMKEPSSWIGVGTFLGYTGFHVDPGVWQNLTLVLSGLCGLLAVVLPG